MEMPNSCDDCPMFDYSGDYPFCNVTYHSSGYNFPFKKKRMDDCPLSEENDDFAYHEIDWYYACGGLSDDYSIVNGNPFNSEDEK
jgi:hypothetical protein